ncbi:unnamed protein product [Vicia faba]|uniref:CoA carboxyltransferase N-terminal domain-containing protein n=1 Tax=Vicia faba TaxID=3906 RepID=A0AAV0ZX85_VICFA|nr:unnamed protein product [Vicia faba]
MSSLDRIELSIDPGTWNPMDEDMFPLVPIKWDKPYTEDEPSTKDEYESSTEEEYESSTKDKPSNEPSMEDKPSNEPSTEDKPYTEDESSPQDEPSTEDEYESSPKDEPSTEDEYESSTEDEPYINRLDFYQESTRLLEAVQTGTGQLNGIPVAICIMDFQFLGSSMGSIVGEKITRLIEYATNQLLPLIIFWDVGGKRVIEQTLNKEVPEGSQSAEVFFEKGLLDSIVSRDSLKDFLSELFEFHGCFPWIENEN